MKIAVVFVVLLIILLPVMGASMTGDGTLKGRLQTFVSYGLSLTSFLLCLLTIIVSTYSLTSDIKHKQIYTVVTKPIRRFQILLGKLFGLILLDVVLLALFSGVIYAITICTPIFGKPIYLMLSAGGSLILLFAMIYTVGLDMPVSRKAIRLTLLLLVLVGVVFASTYTVARYAPSFSKMELTQVRNEFYTARAGITPPEIDVTDEVRETYKNLEQADQLPENMSLQQIQARLTTLKKLEKRAVPPGYVLDWEFDNVRPLDPNGSMFIRFKYDVSVTPPDERVSGIWKVGNTRTVETYGSRDTIRTFHEIEFPASLVDNGYLAISFINDPRLNEAVIIFPLEDGMEVLYKADTFTANFARGVLLILLRLVFLACFGTLAASFLSFPVAILFCLCIFLTATVSNFCLDSFYYIGGQLGLVYSYTLRPIVLLLPQFDKFNPANFLVPARLLSWPLLAKAAALIVGIKAFLLLLVALLIFSYREIARVII
jgi:ABC-type transport system involved in multi-copper enzyme maturation permease subunit